VDVNETLLPGVGLRYEFDNADGDRIGVIAHRKGHFEVLVYASKDPDRARRVFRLTEREAEAMSATNRCWPRPGRTNCSMPTTCWW
jgi:TrkA domain protein